MFYGTMEKTARKDLTMKKQNHGYVIGNSVIASEVGTEHLFENVRYNPPCFEPNKNQIVPVGFVDMKITENGKEIPWEISEIIENTYPLYRAKITAGGTVFDFEAFAPITPSLSDDMFMPSALMSFSAVNGTGDITLSLSFEGEGDYDRFLRIDDAFGTTAVSNDVHLTAGTKITAAFGIYDEKSLWTEHFETAFEVSEYAVEVYDMYKEGIEKFISKIPVFGDEKVREYVRWYTQAAVMLTKKDREGNVITMGYNELNQRDSFWTSFMHLLIFPNLERDMIKISAKHQSESGKIPTTILPLIEREYDIDINEYFCLRIARYYKYYRDREFLESFFENYKKSVDFLLSRDYDGDGVPEQESPDNPECFWGDWKDVSYIIGRKTAPHFALLWLAVLKEGKYLAEEMHDSETAEKYSEIYNRAYGKINADYDGTNKGGLWKNDHYVEVWYDGVERDFILEDQTAGIFFDVVPKERISLIYDALKQNECKYGIRETYPYRTGDEVWNPGGIYHNGGIWPWLMFCDIAGRYKNGRENEALELIKTLGYYDLEAPGDYRPNEYLDGESGQNRGFEVQGWSSAVWAVEYFRKTAEKS